MILSLYCRLLRFRYRAVRPRPKSLKISRLPLTLPSVAKDLHIRMMESFASGNLVPVSDILCPGLLTSLRRRISERAPQTALRWRYEQVARPKLMSVRAAIMPQSGEAEGQQNGIVQAIVRITSGQSVQRVKTIKVSKAGNTREKEDRIVVIDSAGDIVPEDLQEVPTPKRSVEYVVLQSVLRRSKMGPWMIWGMAEETTVEKLKGMEAKVGGSSNAQPQT